MAVSVDIADRLYDYSDEEKAAEVVAQFQEAMGLDDEAVVGLWQNESDPRRTELERQIFDAVDANGTVRRARESVPGGISLYIAGEEAAA